MPATPSPRTPSSRGRCRCHEGREARNAVRSLTAVACACSDASAGTAPPPREMATSGLSAAAPVASSQRPIHPVLSEWSGLARPPRVERCEVRSAVRGEPDARQYRELMRIPHRHERLQRGVQADRRLATQREELVVRDAELRAQVVIATVVRHDGVERIVSSAHLHDDEYTGCGVGQLRGRQARTTGREALPPMPPRR